MQILQLLCLEDGKGGGKNVNATFDGCDGVGADICDVGAVGSWWKH